MRCLVFSLHSGVEVWRKKEQRNEKKKTNEKPSSTYPHTPPSPFPVLVCLLPASEQTRPSILHIISLILQHDRPDNHAATRIHTYIHTCENPSSPLFLCSRWPWFSTYPNLINIWLLTTTTNTTPRQQQQQQPPRPDTHHPPSHRKTRPSQPTPAVSISATPA